MKVNKKKCRGTGKAEGNGCNELRYLHKYGLCKECFKHWLFNTNEGNKFLNKSKIQGIKRAEKEREDERRKQKEALIDPKDKLQTKVQKIARLIDKGQLCLARNIRGQMHGGHVYGKGGNKQMRFNLHNIHRQSASSNHFQNDDGLLREGIRYEYGELYMDFINSLKQTPVPKHSTIKYLEFYSKASKIALKLKKEDKLYSKYQRIQLRNEINTKLNIYKPKYCLFKI